MKSPAELLEADIYLAIIRRDLSAADALTVLETTAAEIKAAIVGHRCIHHIDGNVCNNSPENLRVVTLTENSR